MVVFLLVLQTALFGSTTASASFRYELDERSVPAGHDKANLHKLLILAESILPPQLKTSLDKPVTVQFKKLGKRADGARILGRAQTSLMSGKSKIILDSRLLGTEIGSTEILPTLIHETGHLYDDGAYHSDPGVERLNEICRDRKLADSYRAKACFEAAYFARTVSSTRDFISLSGAAGGRRNYLKERSPNAYELESLPESFAVNFEYFLADPEYKCRKPLMYSYLVRHFGHVPFQSVPCTLNRTMYLSSTGGVPELFQLDSSRIYQIHYLAAGKGSAIFSLWGHSMYRVVVCAPHRETPGPDCLKDIAYHLVLSFRANISDYVIDSFKGVFGGYPSLLFVMSFSEILEEYNKVELRDIISYPLLLTALEQERFLTASLEHFWQYQGDYKFLTTNCATESYWLLRAAIHDPVFERLNVLAPGDLEKGLRRIGRLDESKAIVFKSGAEQLKRSFAMIKKTAGLADDNFEQFAARSTAAIRAYLFQKATESNAGLATSKIAANFYVIESYHQRLLTAELQKKLVTQLESQRRLPTHAQKRPWQLAPKPSYGVPLESEVVVEPIENERPIKLTEIEEYESHAKEFIVSTANLKFFAQQLTKKEESR